MPHSMQPIWPYSCSAPSWPNNRSLVRSIANMRSPDLMTRGASGLLVIDVQTKLMDKMAERGRVIANIARLVEGAKVLGVMIQATEQYPKGIGPTVPELASRLPSRP